MRGDFGVKFALKMTITHKLTPFWLVLYERSYRRSNFTTVNE